MSSPEPTLFYLIAGGLLFVLGLYAVFARRHLLRQVIGFNIAGSGIFMVLVATARRTGDRAGDGIADPVPHALVLTGIVVAVSATALALAMAGHLRDSTGKTELPSGDETA